MRALIDFEFVFHTRACWFFLLYGVCREYWFLRFYLLVFLVLVPADKAGNNIIFVCKQFYIKTLMNELGINWTETKKLA